MQTTIDTSVVTAEDRNVLATRRLCTMLGIGTLKPKDVKNLTTALAEAAAFEAAHNSAFVQRILATYRELAETKPVKKTTTTTRTVTPKPPKPKLTAVKHIDPSLFGPNMTIDPYLVQQAYGNAQLRTVLEDFPPSELKKSAAIVEQRNPGTKPTNRRQKQPLIDYIVRYVAG